MTKEILLSDGIHNVLIDDEDFEDLSKYSWYLHTGYAGRNARKIEISTGSSKIVFMHRSIMNPDRILQVDHINRNRLDNRKENLRVVTNLENHRNLPLSSHNKSGYRGVSWSKKRLKWRVTIFNNLKQEHLGYFSDIKDAAKSYDNRAKELGFLNLNFKDI